MDLTLKLPDEVLCHVFSYVTSIIHRFRSAAVNQKFRRCVFKEFKKPLPLVIEMDRGRLCGHKVPRANWPTALEVLAKEAKFKSIESRESLPYYNDLIEALFRIVCKTDCLCQLSSIIYKGPTDGLDSLIRKCPKLSLLCLRSTQSSVRFPELDLPSLLETKAITHLELNLYQYTQQEFIEILRAMNPGVVKVLSICWHHPTDASNFEQALRELRSVAGASLEGLDLMLWNSRPFPGPQQQHNQLFQSIAHFPSLRHWVARGCFFTRSDQLAPALVSLLSKSDRPHQLQMSFTDGFTNSAFPLCEVIQQIRKVVRSYPALVFGFTTESTGCIELKLGRVTLTLCAAARGVCGTDCLCGCCFPNVYKALVSKSRKTAESDGHLENRWLDRCKVGSIAQVINDTECGQSDHKNVLHVEENGTGDMATITFKGHRVEQFKITVSTRPCFDNSCTKCLGLD